MKKVRVIFSAVAITLALTATFAFNATDEEISWYALHQTTGEPQTRLEEEPDCINPQQSIFCSAQYTVVDGEPDELVGPKKMGTIVVS